MSRTTARRSTIRPAALVSPQGAEAVLALVALGRIDAATAPMYRRALRHLADTGLVERDPDTGVFRVSAHPSAAAIPVPPPPPLETLVARVPVDVLAEIDAIAAARGDGSTRSEVARECLAAGLLAWRKGSGTRAAVRAS